MTEPLYYEDPTLRSFQARVLHREMEGERWAVVLDRTAFYPEGGGQPADRGQLNGAEVLDVQKRGEQIRHYLDGGITGLFAEGETVHGSVDWPRRLEYMQQHTGQHIVSASLIEAAGYRTISASLGERYTAVEIDTDTIEEREIEAAETLANETVTRNLPVRIHWIEPEEAEQYNLRKPPPEVERLRIVQIEGVDAAACAGIHVQGTGRVGLIKYDGLEKIRGRLRLHWLIGGRAYRDTRSKDRLVAELNRELTCGTEDILPSVRELRSRLRERGERLAHLERSLAQLRAADLRGSAEVRNGVRLVQEIFDSEEPSFVQAVYQGLLESESTVACLLARSGADLRWWIGCTPELDLPWKRIVPPLFALIEAKGGGRDRSWQGIGKQAGAAEPFLARLRDAIWNHLCGDADG